MTLPDGIKKLPTGVVIHGQRLRISFVYCGDRCRETIPCNGKITKASIAHAERKRNQILTEIYENRFDYATHFPGSSKAKLYSCSGQLIPDSILRFSSAATGEMPSLNV